MKKVINRIIPESKAAGVSLLDLKKAEKELGALFPEEYRELFIETNGARFGEWTLFPIPTTGQSSAVTDIVKQNKQNRSKLLPGELICIGEHPNGNKLCYRIRKRFMQEQIFVWNHKTGKSDCKAITLYTFVDWYVPKVNTKKANTIGKFTVKSGILIVTDPCYQVNEKEQQVILPKVKKGEWTANVFYTPEETVANLQVFYGDKKPGGKWHLCEEMIAVDSAQAGIFDIELFGRDDAIRNLENKYIMDRDETGAIYLAACSNMVTSKNQGGIIQGGAICVSGYGDGLYEVKVKYNIWREIVGVKIEFDDESID